MVAWKMPRAGFVFVNAKDLVKTPMAYAISREKALKKGMSLEILLGQQSRLKM